MQVSGELLTLSLASSYCYFQEAPPFPPALPCRDSVLPQGSVAQWRRQVVGAGGRLQFQLYHKLAVGH